MRIVKLLTVLIAGLGLVLVALSGLALPRPTATSPLNSVLVPALHSSTRANLLHAMNSESFAYASYHAYADGAMQSGHRGLALLWSTIGDVEYYDHFTTEAGLVGLVGSNVANLKASIAAEAEAVTTYTKFAQQAKAQGCSKVATYFTESAGDEAVHQRLFTQALNALQGHGQVPAPPPLQPTTIHRSTAVCGGQTETNLTTAEYSEALAWGEYTLFAQQAANTGQAKLAKLFTGIAAVELQDHFASEAVLSGLVGSNVANLKASIASEAGAVQMYTKFANEADRVGDHTVATAFREIRSDEEGHEASFKQALANLNG
jgi:rubrerythrin